MTVVALLSHSTEISWLMPLAYGYFIVDLFIEDPQYFSFGYAKYILLVYGLNTLGPNSMIEIVPELKALFKFYVCLFVQQSGL